MTLNPATSAWMGWSQVIVKPRVSSLHEQMEGRAPPAVTTAQKLASATPTARAARQKVFIEWWSLLLVNCNRLQSEARLYYAVWCCCHFENACK